MKKIIIIPVLLLSLLFLAACEGEEPTTEASTGAFIGGNTGVTTAFEPFGVLEDGMYSIFDTETFPIEITLNNKGEYEIQSGDVSVELQGPSLDFGGIPSLTKTNSDVIETVSELLTEGGEETITFTEDAEYNQEVNGLVERTWLANVEYNYETYVIMPDICLKGDLKDDRVCDVEGAKTFFVSGAPVSITSVEESASSKGIMALKIGVENVGEGRATIQGEDFSLTQENIAYTIDDAGWECKSSGKLNEARLIDGKADIICKLKTALAEEDLATKQLKLTLQYRYRSEIQESIRIKESDS